MAKVDKEIVEHFKQEFSEYSKDVTDGIKSFSYCVVPHDHRSIPDLVKKKLKNFVSIMSNPEAGYVLILSDSIPAKYQKYWAFHEYDEEINLTGKGKCAKALEHELSLVHQDMPEDYDYAHYINTRLDFFKDLIAYAKSSNYPDEQIQEFEGSLKKLEGLMK
jgi:hypothetical protein